MKMGGDGPEYEEICSVQLASIRFNPDDNALAKLYQAEIASFPPEEAATLDGMKMRRDQAGSLFCYSKSERILLRASTHFAHNPQ